MNTYEKNEFATFKVIYEALEPLEEEVRQRVFASVATMLGINYSSAKSSILPKTIENSEDDDDVEAVIEGSSEDSTFAELYAKTDPTSNPDKALVAGYWLQVCQGNQNFSGFSINGELNNLGHKLSNVTHSLSSLINMKPQLVLQLRKTGKSKQARKTYKLSKAGIDRVKEMIRGQG